MWAEPAVTNTSGGVRRRDWVFAAVVLVASGAEASLRADAGWPLALVGVGLALALAVLVRREHPLLAVSLGFGAFLLLDLLAVVLGEAPLTLFSGAIVVALVYALFRWAAGLDMVLGSAVIAVEFSLSTITDFTGTADAIGGAAVLLFVAALGAAVRYRVVAREQLVEQVKLRERQHLARELHDTVAHHISAIAVQAQAGLVFARSSDSSVIQSLEIIDREAVRTLEEMRSMVGALRDRSDQPASIEGHCLADIEGLGTVGDPSLSVKVALRGDLTNFPIGVETAFFRVAQESVTNAKRHARHATCVEITVIGAATILQLTVTDDGEAAAAHKSKGFGLIGMTERVALLGGTLETGPRTERGWCVCVTIPRAKRETT